MNAAKQECRWRFVEAKFQGSQGQLLAAWETSCDQWCVDSESTPDRHGFRNGFCFCPYCGGPLLLLLGRAEEVAA